MIGNLCDVDGRYYGCDPGAFSSLGVVDMSNKRQTFKAVILDLDGVITDSARLHARAWKRMFDEFLDQRSQREGEDHTPFDIESDYRKYVDGKPRYDGVRSFLAARAIDLPEGTPDDPPEENTVCGLGNRKNELFHELLKTEGVETFEDAVVRIEQWREEDLKLAVVSSSRNCRRILDTAGIAHLFDVVVDGTDAERLDLHGKPEPDIFLEAADQLNVEPADCVLLEDAIAGVASGRAGKFGLVVGVDRDDHGQAMREHGADLVIHDVRELDLQHRP